MIRFVFLSLCLVLFASHDLFLKSESYFLTPEQPTQLFLFNGDFDHSESIVAHDRIVNTQVVGPDFTLSAEAPTYYNEGDITYLYFSTGPSGTYTAGISTRARDIELSAEDFAHYLEHEELTDLAEQRQQLGISDQPARERYAKHVKAILQVGKERTDHYAQPMGYPIEFIPMENPYQKEVGSSLSFQLLLNGKPLPGHTVHFSSAEKAGTAPRAERSIRTDDQGLLQIPLDQAGHWYLSAIHIQESPASGLDYESQWATLTFAVQ